MGLSDGLGTVFTVAASRHHLLETADLSNRQITELVRTNVLERVVRGLYRVPGTRSPLQDVAAALRRHRGAVASHTTSLFLHGIEGRPPARPHLTLPVGATARTSIGTIHRSPVTDVDRAWCHGLPTTTLARAVVDSSDQLDVERLGQVVSEAVARRLTTIGDIEAAACRVEQAPGRRGSGRLRRVLAGWTDRIEPDSVAEATVIRRILGHGLPVPETQFVVLDDAGEFVARVDLAWPDRRVLREYDSDRFHPPTQVEADELRRQRLEALGWSVDVITRGHLLPGRVDWLRALADDLGIGAGTRA